MPTTLAPDTDQPLTFQDALGRAGTCRLRCWSKEHVAVVTQLETNTGPSVTNAIEHVAAAVHAIVGGGIGVVWTLIEHYPHGTPSLKPTFDWVTFENLTMHSELSPEAGHMVNSPEYKGPSWHPLPSRLAWVADVIQ